MMRLARLYSIIGVTLLLISSTRGNLDAASANAVTLPLNGNLPPGASTTPAVKNIQSTAAKLNPQQTNALNQLEGFIKQKKFAQAVNLTESTIKGLFDDLFKAQDAELVKASSSMPSNRLAAKPAEVTNTIVAFLNRFNAILEAMYDEIEQHLKDLAQSLGNENPEVAQSNNKHKSTTPAAWQTEQELVDLLALFFRNDAINKAAESAITKLVLAFMNKQGWLTSGSTAIQSNGWLT